MQWQVNRPLHVLDFDLENRPLAYLGQDFTTGEITAIAWSFGKSIEVRALGEYENILEDFLDAYHLADIVTGHNILRHDLRWLNGACLELGRGPLPPKLVCDTYAHLKNRSGVSASQEALSDMLGIKAPKVAMGQKAWREANRLLPAGIEKTKARAAGDVKQHMALRAKLLSLNWLKPPERWNP